MAIVFTFALSMLAALAFGSIPLWRGVPLAASLYEVGRGNTASRGRHRTRHLLMGGQVAMALVLLVASGLMVRSFQNLRAFDPGFDRDSALTFRIGLPERVYPTRAAAARAHYAILDQLAAMPGVTAVSASTGLPLGRRLFRQHDTRAGPRPTWRHSRSRSPGYARCPADTSRRMGLRLLRGRGIDRDDVERSQPNVVVNQAFVDTVFPSKIRSASASDRTHRHARRPVQKAQGVRRGMAARRRG